MHNNSPIDRTRKPQKAFYTVVEAAVHWAKSEGAKSASDPRINHYTQLILESLKRGDLQASRIQDSPPMPADKTNADGNPSLSSVLSFTDLKRWMVKHFPDLRPAFLFG